MEPLFDTLMPLAKQSLSAWEVIQQQSENNLARMNDSLRKSDDMNDATRDTLKRLEVLAEHVQLNEEKVNQNGLELLKREETVNQYKEQFHQIFDGSKVAENTLFVAHQTRELSSYILKTGYSPEELNSWMEFTDQKLRDAVTLPKAFFEASQWQEELVLIQQELRMDALIPESKVEIEPLPGIQKQQKQSPKGSSTVDDKQKQ